MMYDAMGLADQEETVPESGKSDSTAAVKYKKARLEVKGAEEMASWIRERESGGPGNIIGGVRQSSREMSWIHYTINMAEEEMIPWRPPTTQRVTHGMAGRIM
jgi:hypothetical protein